VAAQTEVFFNPALDSDTGDGLADGTAYGDLKYGTNLETSGGTGYRFNVKAGTAEVLTENYTLSTFGAATIAAPLTIEGYTSSPGDGGIGAIDGANLYALFGSTSYLYITLKNLRIFNCNATYAVRLGTYSQILNCEIDDNDATYAIHMGAYGSVKNCYIHDCSGYGVYMTAQGGVTYQNRLIDGTKKFTPQAVRIVNVTGAVRDNVISVSGACDGVLSRHGSTVSGNSIYSDGGTGQGVTVVSTEPQGDISNNLIEGFSGVGGIGIELAATGYVVTCDGNAFYDCTTNIANSDRILAGNTDNETLSASPFVDAANGDFTPVDTGNVKDGALPQYVGLY